MPPITFNEYGIHTSCMDESLLTKREAFVLDQKVQSATDGRFSIPYGDCNGPYFGVGSSITLLIMTMSFTPYAMTSTQLDVSCTGTFRSCRAYTETILYQPISPDNSTPPKLLDAKRSVEKLSRRDFKKAAQIIEETFIEKNKKSKAAGPQ